MSINSSFSIFESDDVYQIPNQIGYRPANAIYERPLSTLKTIRRDNRKVEALTLPRIVNYNMRSFFPKCANFAQDVHERESDAIFLTEVWDKQENKKHQNKIEELLEMQGIKYISTPRPGAQRGGGAGIAVRLDRFNVSKLNISIPKSLEVVWGLLRPKDITGKITTIIVCCFYSPPRSRKNNQLIDHITVNLQTLLNIHNNAGIIISGDRNDMDISALLSIDPSLRQTVLRGTRGLKVLDVIVTNLSRYSNEPVIIPPVMPDRLGHGVQSDHCGVSASPSTNMNESEKMLKVKRTIRPIPESLLSTFEEKLSNLNFGVLRDLPVLKMVDLFQSMVNSILCDTFPEKQILISPYDDPWFSEELRHLKRQRQRQYTRHGKNKKYDELKTKFDDKLRNAKLKYRDKIELEVRVGKRGSTYPALKRLGSRLFEKTQPDFQLPAHAEQNLSSTQSAELIADHFSKISQEFSPLDLSCLPSNVKSFLANYDENLAPKLSTFDVHARIIKAKKPNSSVPGDIRKSLFSIAQKHFQFQQQ